MLVTYEWRSNSEELKGKIGIYVYMSNIDIGRGSVPFFYTTGKNGEGQTRITMHWEYNRTSTPGQNCACLN